MADPSGREESGTGPGSERGEQRGALPGPAEEPSRRGQAGRRDSCAASPCSPSPRVEAASALAPSPRPRDNDSHGSLPLQPFQGKSGSLSAVLLNLSFLPASLSLSPALYSTEPFISVFWQLTGPSADPISTCSSLRFPLVPQ